MNLLQDNVKLLSVFFPEKLLFPECRIFRLTDRVPKVYFLKTNLFNLKLTGLNFKPLPLEITAIFQKSNFKIFCWEHQNKTYIINRQKSLNLQT